MRNPYDAIGRIGVLLAIVGAINWLLVGLFQWNFVQWVFTSSATQTATTGERIVYVVVGIGGILAIPMLAATLARSRSRDVAYEERGSGRTDREIDAGFYAGAKDDREADRSVRPGRIGEPQDQPVRRTERVIYRTEEPISVPSDNASPSPAEGPVRDTEAGLRPAPVEQTDEGPGEGANEQRPAA